MIEINLYDEKKIPFFIYVLLFSIEKFGVVFDTDINQSHEISQKMSTSIRSTSDVVWISHELP